MFFQKLTEAGLQMVRPLLQSQLPLSGQVLNIVDLQLKDISLKNTFKTQFYGIPGTEILNVSWIPTKRSPKGLPRINLIYAPPPSISSSKLDTGEVVQAYHDYINWQRPQIFEAVPMHIAPTLEKLIQANAGQITQKIPLSLLHLPAEEVNKLKTKQVEERVLNKFEMHKLTKKDAQKICPYWKYGSERKIGYLRELIHTFEGGRGIFIKGDPTNAGLVCWAMLLEIGTIGCLFTLEEARGYGLAQYVFEECCKMAAEEYGLLPLCEVESDNTASIKLMEKIGMRKVTDAYYMKYVPTKVTSYKTKQVNLPPFMKVGSVIF